MLGMMDVVVSVASQEIAFAAFPRLGGLGNEYHI